ncbi:hypothetical protein [Paenibacillus alvei]|uniref:hypothetical protein n=1 Tax=Paenibacillus alvei TaxID=44250 RepID=UPI0018CD2713|nr:hypothetical protein [Paenibacillus alvei]MBG9736467.1 hypothetical protein [Paenibacillus alvei]MBG9745592.1 hypothetical protein [Paenibacillus alvei]MCY9577970.1 hypothetical protein [Paenibacillus alvei]
MHEVFTGKITVSSHAIDEAVKDFRVNRKVADEWIRSNLRKARFIADIVSDELKPRRLYGFQRIAFILEVDRNHVITVHPRHHSVTELKRKIEAIVFRELRKAQRLESVTERKHRLTKAELNVERAQLLLKIERARSESTKLACNARINAIDEYIAQLDAEFTKILKEKSAIAKSAIAFI